MGDDSKYTTDIADEFTRVNQKLDKLIDTLPERYVAQSTLKQTIDAIEHHIEAEVSKADVIHQKLNQRIDLELANLTTKIDNVGKTADRSQTVINWAARIIVAIVICAVIGTVIVTHGFVIG